MHAVTRRWKSAAIVLSILAGLGIAEYLTLDPLAGRILLLIVGDDTEFSPGYRDSVFRAIEIGDSERAVLDRLGDPIVVVTHQNGEHSLQYSRSPNDSHYRLRVIVISAGVVTSKHSGVWID